MTAPAPFSLYRPALPPASALPNRILDPEAIRWRNGLIVRATNWLGDTVMSLPGVHALRQLLPDPCGLFVTCRAGLAPIWEAAPWVDDVIPIQGSRLRGGAARRARRLVAGVGVVLPNSFGSAWDFLGLDLPVRVGRGGRGRSALLTHVLPDWQHSQSEGCHQVSHYLEVAAAMGAAMLDPAIPPLTIDNEQEALGALGITDTEDAPLLLLAPGAAYGPAKQWPPASFREVARQWTARGGRVAVVGSEGERDTAQQVVQDVRGAINLAGRTDLRQLMTAFRAADAVVTNDSGSMHLAAALGTQGVAVFGSTDPVATGPLGERWVVLHQPVECSPCFERTCRRPEDDYACLTRIAPQTVCDALEWLLQTESKEREPLSSHG